MTTTDGIPRVEESVDDLYEHAPCGYLSTLPDGRILKVNATFLNWTGYGRDELLERARFPELLAMGSRLFHETHVVPLLRLESEAREIACDLRMADGGLLPVLLNATRRELPSTGSTGAAASGGAAPSGGAVVFRYMVLDATERLRYERDLLEARRDAEAALKRVRDLESLLPVCAWCRRVQTQEGAWLELEEFLDASGTRVTHGICGSCEKTMAR